MPLALITDCESTRLTAEEKAFFSEIQPFGFILFQRHCESPEQVKALVADLQACVEHEAPIFIDQEGGRVARLKPPHWEAYPPAGDFAACAAAHGPQMGEVACYANARLIADELIALGINADCAPLADIPVPGAHDIIGDRAFGRTAECVTLLARAQARGLMDGGVLPVLKHIPGHGRATADSHHDLPRVDAPLAELEQSDFVPFKALADLPFGMTAHIVYSALDAERPATLSPIVISYIREQIGFTNLLMSDDISMKALHSPSSPRKRGSQEADSRLRGNDNISLDAIAAATLDAGCDLVLHCNGSFEERRLAASGCREMLSARYGLYERARQAIAEPGNIDREALRIERDSRLNHQVA